MMLGRYIRLMFAKYLSETTIQAFGNFVTLVGIFRYLSSETVIKRYNTLWLR